MITRKVGKECNHMHAHHTGVFGVLQTPVFITLQTQTTAANLVATINKL